MFLVATTTSDLPKKKLAVSVGTIAPDFTGTDATGRDFRLSDLCSRPVLLKFYRGFRANLTSALDSASLVTAACG